MKKNKDHSCGRGVSNTNSIPLVAKRERGDYYYYYSGGGMVTDAASTNGEAGVSTLWCDHEERLVAQAMNFHTEDKQILDAANGTPRLCLALGALMDGVASCHFTEAWTGFFKASGHDRSEQSDKPRLLTAPSTCRKSTEERDNTVVAATLINESRDDIETAEHAIQRSVPAVIQKDVVITQDNHAVIITSEDPFREVPSNDSSLSEASSFQEIQTELIDLDLTYQDLFGAEVFVDSCGTYLFDRDDLTQQEQQSVTTELRSVPDKEDDLTYSTGKTSTSIQNLLQEFRDSAHRRTSKKRGRRRRRKHQQEKEMAGDSSLDFSLEKGIYDDDMLDAIADLVVTVLNDIPFKKRRSFGWFRMGGGRKGDASSDDDLEKAIRELPSTSAQPHPQIYIVSSKKKSAFVNVQEKEPQAQQAEIKPDPVVSGHKNKLVNVQEKEPQAQQAEIKPDPIVSGRKNKNKRANLFVRPWFKRTQKNVPQDANDDDDDEEIAKVLQELQIVKGGSTGTTSSRPLPPAGGSSRAPKTARKFTSSDSVRSTVSFSSTVTYYSYDSQTPERKEELKVTPEVSPTNVKETAKEDVSCATHESDKGLQDKVDEAAVAEDAIRADIEVSVASFETTAASYYDSGDVLVETVSETTSTPENRAVPHKKKDDLEGVETILGMCDTPQEIVIENKKVEKHQNRPWISKKNGRVEAHRSFDMSNMGIISVDTVNTSKLERLFDKETRDIESVGDTSTEDAPSKNSSKQSSNSNCQVSISDVHLDILAEALGDCAYVHKRTIDPHTTNEDNSSKNALLQRIAGLDVSRKTKLLRKLTKTLKRSQLKRLAVALALSYQKTKETKAALTRLTPAPTAPSRGTWSMWRPLPTVTE